ncbi:hypothetical protein [Pendulispora albinea]|uniref:Uncharacterized protein n=1 Tax=Pendulispora albinea TaxID=2741071 RepID=A0ABZ2LSA0_9BACT
MRAASRFATIASALLVWLVPHGAGAESTPSPWTQRPPEDPARLRACSFRHPLCVHANLPETILTVLSDAERAWDAAVGPLALPPPDPSPSTRAYDIYLTDRTPNDVLTAFDERDTLSRFDRASAFTLLDPRLTGCARTQAVARGLLRAIAYRTTPGLDPAGGEAQTSYLAQLIAPCAAAEASALGTFQAHPERAIPDAWPEWSSEAGASFSRGAALFYDWMDGSFGQEPGSLVRAMWALSPRIAPSREPDGFDVLRASFKNALSTGSTLDDLLSGFGVARALVPPVPMPVRMDWQIDWPAKPRRLAPRDPTAPTGSAYVVIRRGDAPKGARLRVEVSWEEHAKMRWVVVKRDPAGRELSRVPIASAERAIEAQGSIVDLDTVDSLLIVGTNTGDPFEPFDPDDAIWEPHGWRLTVAAE